MITITFYFCALARQSGYLTYFNIPVAYVSLTPAMVLTTSLQLVALVIVVLISLMFLSIPVAALITSLRDRLTRLLEYLFGSRRLGNPPFSLLDRFMPDAVIILVVFAAIMSLVAYSLYAGKWDAEHRETFFIVKKFPGLPEDLVVVQFSGDYLVTAPLDRAAGEVEKKIYLLKVSDMGHTPIDHEKIGRLKVKQ
jgi:hypothetical protein